jgi:hypothetical protein
MKVGVLLSKTIVNLRIKAGKEKHYIRITTLFPFRHFVRDITVSCLLTSRRQSIVKRAYCGGNTAQSEKPAVPILSQLNAISTLLLLSMALQPKSGPDLLFFEVS